MPCEKDLGIMTTPEKCQAILHKIVELINLGQRVTFEDDFGGNTLTVVVGAGHTHCGVPDGDFSLLVDNLYDSLHDGPGLSWYNSEQKG